MKKFLLILPIIFLTGCNLNEHLTNEEIISEVKKCTDAGLGAKTIINGWTLETTSIICEVKND